MHHEGRHVEHTTIVPDPAKEADRILLNRYSPAGVIVNSDFEVIQFRGDTGKYLSPAPGKASLNLLKMLREGLLVSVRAALHKAKREGGPVREEGLRVRTNGGHRDVNIEVIPIRRNEQVGSYLIVFEDPNQANFHEAQTPPESSTVMEGSEAERELNRMRQELAATREYLQSVVEQQDAANEELQSANEEIQSSNEELQSINEELETSKEEIQSSNEELATLNEELQHRNAELSQSNNDLINLISSVHMPMVMIGRDLRIRKFSPAAEKLLNLIPTDTGRPFTDIKLNLSVTDFDQKIEDVIVAVRSLEEEVRDKSGRRYLLRIRPYKTLENKIDGAVIILIDIDEPMARETQILQRVHEPVFMWGVDSGISYWNKAAEETYGYSKQEAMGKMPEELLMASPGVFLDDLRRNNRWAGEVVHSTKSGEKIVMESRISYFQEPGASALVIEANRPTSDSRRQDAAAASSENPFPGDPHRNQFLAMLAHELRNPLAPLRNAVQVLHHPGADEEMRGRALRMLDRQVRNMTRLVDDLLDISRLAQGKITLQKEKVDAGSVLKRAIEQLDHNSSSREQKIKAEIPKKPVFLEADPLRLEQIFTNLLSNASKFTADGGHISVILEDGAEKNSDVVIRIKDDGFGIAPEHLAGIFDLFGAESLLTGKSQQGGLGIGLSLVRDLVREHGGTIEAVSEGQGRGSEFILRLPKDGKTSSTNSPESGAKSTAAAGSRKVLVVDDNVDAADSLAILLRMAGYAVHIAYDGPETLKMVRAFRPDVILLDIGLPGMDGYEVARELKKLPEMERCILVAVTGYAREDDRRRAQDAGFHFHLTKPINHESLKALLADRGE
jgi:two-component system CheB/CheR fusion protein